MKKRIFFIIILFTFLIIICLVDSFGSETKGGGITIQTLFKMEIFEDGKLNEDKMLVDLTILQQDSGNFYVEWNEVYIDPVHERKVVILKPVHHSTLNGSIKNVMVTEKGFSFAIDLSRQFLGEGRTLQIVGTKKKEGILFSEYNVEGSGLWWSEILKKSIKKNLRSTDKKIMLPYKEVF